MGDGIGEGSPALSPLTGAYLLVILPQTHAKEHLEPVIHKLTKGLLSWDPDCCHVDLYKELQTITSHSPEGELVKHGERLIQFASENLVTEVLIHPQLNTLVQCLRNLLSSFTRHRHIIHAGYTYSGNGSWILQDGTFSFADFHHMFQEIEVQRVLVAYENTVTMDIHCCQEGDWANVKITKEPFAKLSRLSINPDDKLSVNDDVRNFAEYLRPYIVSYSLEQLLEPSDVVGNIRFSHPTLYVFPGGQGDAALFGINGFNMLVDGGFSRKTCFWDFTRHLDRLDAALVTRLNNGNIQGISSFLQRKKMNHVYPQIGHFFCNVQDRKQPLSPDGDKDRDPMLINIIDQGQELVSSLHHLNLKPQPCYRDTSMSPINLYHKVGHGKLDMYVLSPSKDSREVKDFLTRWNANDIKLFATINKKSGEFSFPLPNRVSICALLVWQPANPNDNITRLLFPGSTPQHKIMDGLEKIKQLEFLKHPVCSAKSLSPSSSTIGLNIRQNAKLKPHSEKPSQPLTNDMKPIKLAEPIRAPKADVPDVKTKPSRTKKVAEKTRDEKIKEEKIKEEKLKEEKAKEDKTKDEKAKEEEEKEEKAETEAVIEKDIIPEKAIEVQEEKQLEPVEDIPRQVEIEITKEVVTNSLETEITKDQENEKVLEKNLENLIEESKEIKTDLEAKAEIISTDKPKKEMDTKKLKTDSVKKGDKITKKREVPEKSDKVEKEDKPKRTVSKRPERRVPKPPPKAEEKKTESAKSSPTTPKKTPIPKSMGEPKTRPLKTRPSPSATPAKSTKEENNRKVVEQRAQKIQAKKEEVKKIDRKPLTRKAPAEPPREVKKEKSPLKAVTKSKPKKAPSEKESKTTASALSSQVPPKGKAIKGKKVAESEIKIISDIVKDTDALNGDVSLSKEEDEILIVEKIELELYPEEVPSEEKEAAGIIEPEAISKDKDLVNELKEGEAEEIKEEVTGIINTATDIVMKVKSPEEAEKAIKDKLQLKEADKELKEKSNEMEQKQQAEESHPDEKFSATVESGATTTAPTLPEDERIPIEDVKEVEGIEEKHVKEDTKEKEVQHRPEQLESKPEPAITSFDQKAQILRDIVKTPDEVADLPVHEVAEYESAEPGIRDIMHEQMRPEEVSSDELKFIKDGLEKEDKSKDLKEDLKELPEPPIEKIESKPVESEVIPLIMETTSKPDEEDETALDKEQEDLIEAKTGIEDAEIPPQEVKEALIVKKKEDEEISSEEKTEEKVEVKAEEAQLDDDKAEDVLPSEDKESQGPAVIEKDKDGIPKIVEEEQPDDRKPEELAEVIEEIKDVVQEKEEPEKAAEDDQAVKEDTKNIVLKTEEAGEKKDEEALAVKEIFGEEMADKKIAEDVPAIEDKTGEEPAAEKKVEEIPAIEEETKDDVPEKAETVETQKIEEKAEEDLAVKETAEEVSEIDKKSEEPAADDKKDEELSAVEKESKDSVVVEYETKQPEIKVEEQVEVDKQAEETGPVEKEADEAATAKEESKEIVLEKEKDEEAVNVEKQTEEAELVEKEAKELVVAKEKSKDITSEKEKEEKAEAEEKQAEEVEPVEKETKEPAAAAKEESKDIALEKEKDEEAVAEEKQAEEAEPVEKETKEPGAAAKEDSKDIAQEKEKDEEAVAEEKQAEETEPVAKEAKEPAAAKEEPKDITQEKDKDEKAIEVEKQAEEAKPVEKEAKETAAAAKVEPKDIALEKEKDEEIVAIEKQAEEAEPVEKEATEPAAAKEEPKDITPEKEVKEEPAAVKKEERETEPVETQAKEPAAIDDSKDIVIEKEKDEQSLAVDEQTEKAVEKETKEPAAAIVESKDATPEKIKAEEEAATEKAERAEEVSKEQSTEEMKTEEVHTMEEKTEVKSTVEETAEEEPTVETKDEEKPPVGAIPKEELMVEKKAEKETTVEEKTKEEPAEDKQTEEQPAVEEKAKEEPIEEKKTEQVPAVEMKTKDEPAVGKKAEEVPAVEKEVKDEPAVGKKAEEVPAVEKEVKEEPAVGKKAEEVPTVEKEAKEEPDEGKKAEEVAAVEEKDKKELGTEEKVEDVPTVGLKAKEESTVENKAEDSSLVETTVKEEPAVEKKVEVELTSEKKSDELVAVEKKIEDATVTQEKVPAGEKTHDGKEAEEPEAVKEDAKKDVLEEKHKDGTTEVKTEGVPVEQTKEDAKKEEVEEKSKDVATIEENDEETVQDKEKAEDVSSEKEGHPIQIEEALKVEEKVEDTFDKTDDAKDVKEKTVEALEVKGKVEELLEVDGKIDEAQEVKEETEKSSEAKEKTEEALEAKEKADDVLEVKGKSEEALKVQEGKDPSDAKEEVAGGTLKAEEKDSAIKEKADEASVVSDKVEQALEVKEKEAEVLSIKESHQLEATTEGSQSVKKSIEDIATEVTVEEQKDIIQVVEKAAEITSDKSETTIQDKPEEKAKEDLKASTPIDDKTEEIKSTDLKSEEKLSDIDEKAQLAVKKPEDIPLEKEKPENIQTDEKKVEDILPAGDDIHTILPEESKLLTDSKEVTEKILSSEKEHEAKVTDEKDDKPKDIQTQEPQTHDTVEASQVVEAPPAQLVKDDLKEVSQELTQDIKDETVKEERSSSPDAHLEKKDESTKATAEDTPDVQSDSVKVDISKLTSGIEKSGEADTLKEESDKPESKEDVTVEPSPTKAKEQLLNDDKTKKEVAKEEVKASIPTQEEVVKETIIKETRSPFLTSPQEIIQEEEVGLENEALDETETDVVKGKTVVDDKQKTEEENKGIKVDESIKKEDSDIPKLEKVEAGSDTISKLEKESDVKKNKELESELGALAHSEEKLAEPKVVEQTEAKEKKDSEIALEVAEKEDITKLSEATPLDASILKEKESEKSVGPQSSEKAVEVDEGKEAILDSSDKDKKAPEDVVKKIDDTLVEKADSELKMITSTDKKTVDVKVAKVKDDKERVSELEEYVKTFEDLPQDVKDDLKSTKAYKDHLKEAVVLDDDVDVTEEKEETDVKDGKEDMKTDTNTIAPIDINKDDKKEKPLAEVAEDQLTTTKTVDITSEDSAIPEVTSAKLCLSEEGVKIETMTDSEVVQSDSSTKATEISKEVESKGEETADKLVIKDDTKASITVVSDADPGVSIYERQETIDIKEKEDKQKSEKEALNLSGGEEVEVDDAEIVKQSKPEETISSSAVLQESKTDDALKLEATATQKEEPAVSTAKESVVVSEHLKPEKIESSNVTDSKSESISVDIKEVDHKEKESSEKVESKKIEPPQKLEETEALKDGAKGEPQQVKKEVQEKIIEESSAMSLEAPVVEEVITKEISKVVSANIPHSQMSEEEILKEIEQDIIPLTSSKRSIQTEDVHEKKKVSHHDQQAKIPVDEKIEAVRLPYVKSEAPQPDEEGLTSFQRVMEEKAKLEDSKTVAAEQETKGMSIVDSVLGTIVKTCEKVADEILKKEVKTVSATQIDTKDVDGFSQSLSKEKDEVVKSKIDLEKLESEIVCETEVVPVKDIKKEDSVVAPVKIEKEKEIESIEKEVTISETITDKKEKTDEHDSAKSEVEDERKAIADSSSKTDLSSSKGEQAVSSADFSVDILSSKIDDIKATADKETTDLGKDSEKQKAESPESAGEQKMIAEIESISDKLHSSPIPDDVTKAQAVTETKDNIVQGEVKEKQAISKVEESDRDEKEKLKSTEELILNDQTISKEIVKDLSASIIKDTSDVDFSELPPQQFKGEEIVDTSDIEPTVVESKIESSESIQKEMPSEKLETLPPPEKQLGGKDEGKDAEKASVIKKELDHQSSPAKKSEKVEAEESKEAVTISKADDEKIASPGTIKIEEKGTTKDEVATHQVSKDEKLSLKDSVKDTSPEPMALIEDKKEGKPATDERKDGNNDKTEKSGEKVEEPPKSDDLKIELDTGSDSLPEKVSFEPVKSEIKGEEDLKKSEPEEILKTSPITSDSSSKDEKTDVAKSVDKTVEQKPDSEGEKLLTDQSQDKASSSLKEVSTKIEVDEASPELKVKEKEIEKSSVQKELQETSEMDSNKLDDSKETSSSTEDIEPSKTLLDSAIGSLTKETKTTETKSQIEINSKIVSTDETKEVESSSISQLIESSELQSALFKDIKSLTTSAYDQENVLKEVAQELKSSSEQIAQEISEKVQKTSDTLLESLEKSRSSIVESVTERTQSIVADKTMTEVKEESKSPSESVVSKPVIETKEAKSEVIKESKSEEVKEIIATSGKESEDKGSKDKDDSKKSEKSEGKSAEDKTDLSSRQDSESTSGTTVTESTTVLVSKKESLSKESVDSSSVLKATEDIKEQTLSIKEESENKKDVSKEKELSVTIEKIGETSPKEKSKKIEETVISDVTPVTKESEQFLVKLDFGMDAPETPRVEDTPDFRKFDSTTSEEAKHSDSRLQTELDISSSLTDNNKETEKEDRLKRVEPSAHETVIKQTDIVERTSKAVESDSVISDKKISITKVDTIKVSQRPEEVEIGKKDEAEDVVQKHETETLEKTIKESSQTKLSSEKGASTETSQKQDPTVKTFTSSFLEMESSKSAEQGFKADVESSTVRIVSEKKEGKGDIGVSSVIYELRKDMPTRSGTPGSDIASESATPRSDLSSGQASKSVSHWEASEERLEHFDSDEEIPGSPMSIASHIPSPPNFDYEPRGKDSAMTSSFYGSLPDDPDKKDTFEAMYISKYEDDSEVDPKVFSPTKVGPFEAKVSSERRDSMNLNGTKDTSKPLPEGRGESSKDPIESWGKPLGLPPPPKSMKNYDDWNPIVEWGHPLGLPSPAPPTKENGDIDLNLSNQSPTRRKIEKMNAENERIASNIYSGKETINKILKRSESPIKKNIKGETKKGTSVSPIYLDLTYVPHHGNSHYADVEFFKKIRARYYVFSGTEPSKEVFNALLEAKQTWEDKDLEVTIIPTYDTDTLAYWVAENEETLTKNKIDLSPSASRCTINLQDHETSCSAYRLEF